ncbi:MAG: hypothetical protein Q9174_005514 [Haloplaca sp. 1 TL-2023]
MAYPQIYPRTTIDEPADVTASSLRSRASSIVTTTTKFSLETLSQDDQSSLRTRWDGHRGGGRDRPRSMISMASIARPAPPYSEAVNSGSPVSHEHGILQRQLGLLAEAARQPSETVSLNEALPPSPEPSEATTPLPDSPVDPDENPHAQAAYYSNVVRTLDQNYTAAIERLRQEHVKEIATTRHDIDQAYRAQWKVKNQQIERIREEATKARDEEIASLRGLYEERYKDMEEKVSRLENELQAEKDKRQVAVEKARHEVEDVWEKRWSDRNEVEKSEQQRINRVKISRIKPWEDKEAVARLLNPHSLPEVEDLQALARHMKSERILE